MFVAQGLELLLRQLLDGLKGPSTLRYTRAPLQQLFVDNVYQAILLSEIGHGFFELFEVEVVEWVVNTVGVIVSEMRRFRTARIVIYLGQRS